MALKVENKHNFEASKVLIVDDTFLNRMLLKEFLKDFLLIGRS